jgi:Ser/Thr protein kinase RdoA (MazF antagonist)
LLVPLEILRAYGLPTDESDLELEHVPSNINATYIVARASTGPAPLVLQRLHRVFGAKVHFDIEAVTAHLSARGLMTPRLVPTRSGELWTVDESPEARVWRALTHVDGVTLHATSDPARLESAAALLGTFHRTLVDLEHQFVHERPLHDTQRHLTALRAALASERAAADSQAQELGARVLRQAEGIRRDFQHFPRRIIHGDPKLSNVMFQREPSLDACCMIDLDTVGRGHLAYELGDALRSWCNPAGEDTAEPHLHSDAFLSVMRGYARTCPAEVSRLELMSAIDGFETVAVELSSRFAADMIVDNYFGWDALRFASRREHNALRAEGQLALARAIRAQRPELIEMANEAIGAAASQPARSGAKP